MAKITAPLLISWHHSINQVSGQMAGSFKSEDISRAVVHQWAKRLYDLALIMDSLSRAPGQRKLVSKQSLQQNGE